MMRNVIAALLVSMPIAAAAGMEHVSTRDVKATYTGCLEPGNAPGTFTLTRIERRADAAKAETSAHGPMSADGPDVTTLNVGSTTVGLTGHLGQKVAVTGSSSDAGVRPIGTGGRPMDTPAFVVKSLKIVANSCS